MIVLAKTCPLCKSDLKAKIKNNSYAFFCRSCGFDKIGPPGYDLDSSYDWISSSKSMRKNKSSTGFKTKTKRRRSITKTSKRLEEDKIINDNAKRIREKIVDVDLPEALSNILEDSTHLPVYFEKLNQRLPELGNLVEDTKFVTSLQNKMKDKNIDQLFKFQEDAIEEILNGNNVVISAPTGLGKTEAFLLPILHSIIAIESNPSKRNTISALFVYPTKALAADQFSKIEYYAKSIGIRVAIYDGDTPQEKRHLIYYNPPDLLISNADMVHYHLMGNLDFKALISTIRYVVIDEIHLCVGAYGTNVLWIIRRLRRFSPGLQCIGASATISNAKEFTETIFDKPVKLISTGTARRSEMYLTMLYPLERSNLSTMTSVAHNFVNAGNKTLVFGNGHLSSEVINMILKQNRVKSGVHRAGLGYTYRKKIEEEFRRGDLDVLVSTPTLELGIDIGSLDSVVSMLTSLTSFVQRIGRAGRAGQESYATLVLRGDDPISAHYARNPQDYLSELEPAFVEPDNEFVSSYQILAMLLDKPLNKIEKQHYSKYLEPLFENNKIGIIKENVMLKNRSWAQKKLQNYSIRGIGNSVKIFHLDNKIGERILPMALRELHEGAIYLHGGKSYKVNKYNQQLGMAKLNQVSSNNMKTQASRSISPEILSINYETEINGLAAVYAKIELTESVYGYSQHDIFTNKILGTYTLDDPISYSFNTMGFILALPKPDKFVEGMDSKTRMEKLGGTFHAVEHVLIESGNSLTGGGSNQIGGIAMGDTGTIFVYDGTEGGSGLSKLLFDSLEKGLNRSLKILQDCSCGREDGCPRCTYSYQCGNNNRPLNRLGAIETLKQFGSLSTALDLNFRGVESFVAYPDYYINYY